jgi:hypothetical protein
VRRIANACSKQLGSGLYVLECEIINIKEI